MKLVHVLAALLLAAPMLAPSTSGGMYPPQERFGVGVARQYGDITAYDVGRLHVGWYMDWGFRANPPHPGGIEYAQLIMTRAVLLPSDWAALSQAVSANRGAMWFIGNEPDASAGVADAQSPDAYAQIYHDLYVFIKRIDSSARIGPGGVIEPTPLRLRYQDMILSAYATRYGQAMPVDFWATHVQILQERRNDWGAGIPTGIEDDAGRSYTIQDNADPAVFEQLIRDLRTWMAGRGMRNKPLIVSEYGVLMPSLYLCYCFEHETGDQMVISFMRRTFDFMLTARDSQTGYPADDNRLVQRWSWYSLNEKPYDEEPRGEGYNGGLFDWRVPQFPGVLTVFGRAFAAYTRELLYTQRVHLPSIISAR